MADDVQSNIRIDIQTGEALANLKKLQAEISAFHTSMAKGSASAVAASRNLQNVLINGINKTGDFAASFTKVRSETEQFTTSLEKNKFSMGEYFRYAGASTKTFGKLFKKEYDTIGKVAESRVRTLQTQYIQMGRSASGAMQAIKVRPLALDMDNLATRTSIAAQKQQILNQLLKQGSTNLLNFGKNTQWAGRQLMVGFTVPLTMLGTTAAKVFMDMEKQAIKFKRVYGDSFTAGAETDKMLSQVKQLAQEFTKYGVAVSDTMAMAADAAAMGKQGAELMAQVANATRLAVLGGVEQQQALETTTSLTNAFGLAADKLAGKIDFLNAVENQTVTSIEDLTIAIPKAAPVIQQLGGNVEDLAFFLTAMKEGGINASEGANALKSGLSAMINPTGKAAEMLQGFGINLKGIVEANKGDVKGTVVKFAQALDTLDPLNRARAIEQLFGKFQFARISTLFKNVVAEGSQANRVLGLARSTTEELAILSEREMKRIEESPMYKFQKAIEDIKVSLVPLGEAFLKAVTPIIQFGTDILKKFNGMDEGAKNFLVTLTGIGGVIGPALLMTFGLVANGVANLIKMFSLIKSGYNRLTGTSRDLSGQTKYMTQEQLEAAAVASSLDQAHGKLITTFTSEASAVAKLVAEYQKAIAAQNAFMGTPTRRTKSKKYASGGLVTGPGTGTSDSVPAMLSNGEAVIPAKNVAKNPGLVKGLIDGDVPGYAKGFFPFKSPFGGMLRRSRVATRTSLEDLLSVIAGGRYKSGFETQRGADWMTVGGRTNERQIALRAQMERDVMGFGAFGTPANQRPTYGSVATVSKFAIFLNKLFGGLAGKQFNQVTDPRSQTLDRYGDISLIGKRSLNKRSNVFAGDILKAYSQSPARFMNGFSLPSMLGANPENLRKQGRFGQLEKEFGKSYQNPNGSFSANPGVGYIESYVKGGFSVNEIKKILVKNPELIPQIQAALKAQGIKIPVGKFATGGIVKGPGTGTSDSIPSMLSDGEAVIPAKAVKKNPAVVSALLSGRKIKIPGFSRGDGGAAKKAGSTKKPVYFSGFSGDLSHFGEGLTVTVQKLRELLTVAGNTEGLEKLEATIVDLNKKAKKTRGAKLIDDNTEVHAFDNRVLDLPSTLNRRFGRNNSLPIEDVIAGVKRAGKNAHSQLIYEMKQMGATDKEINEVITKITKDIDAKMQKLGNGVKISSDKFNKIVEEAYSSNIGTPVKKGKETKAQKAYAKMKEITTFSQVGARSTDRVILNGVGGRNPSYKATAKEENNQRATAARVTRRKAFAGQGKMYWEAKERPLAQMVANKLTMDQIQKLSDTKDYAARTALLNKYVDELNGGTKAVKEKANADKQSTKVTKTNTEAKKKEAAVSKKKAAADAAAATAVTQSQMRKDAAIRGWETRRQNQEAAILAESKKRTIKERAAGVLGKAKAGMGKMGAGGVGMAASGVMMAASMMPGKVGEIAQAASMPVMIASMLGPMLMPLISNPIGLAVTGVVAAIGLLAFAAIDASNKLNEVRDSAAKTAKETGNGETAMKNFAMAAGKATPNEIMSRRREAGFTQYGIKPGKSTYGQTFFQKQEGQAFKKQAINLIKTEGRDVAKSKISTQLATAVVQGIFSKEQAASIVQSLGIQLRDYKFSMDINGKIRSILGPDGADLTKSPLELKQRLVADGSNKVSDLSQIFGKGQEKLVLGSTIAQGFVDFFDENKDVVEEVQKRAAYYAKIEGQVSGELQNQIQLQQSMVDSLDLQYQAKAESLKAAGKEKELTELTLNYERNRSNLLASNAENSKNIVENLRKIPKLNKDQIIGNLEKDIKSRYAGTESEQSAQSVIDKINRRRDSGIISNTTEMIFKAQVASGQMSPEALENFSGIFAGTNDNKTWNALANITGKIGGAGANDLLKVTEFFGDEKGSKKKKSDFIISMSKTDPDNISGQIEFFKGLTQLGNGMIPVDIMLDFYTKNPEAADEAMRQINEYTKLEAKGPVTAKTVLSQVFKSDTAGFNVLKQNQKYFDSLDDVQKKIYVNAVINYSQTLDPNGQDFANWLNQTEIKKDGLFDRFVQKNKNKTFADYVQFMSQQFVDSMTAINNAADTTTSNSGGSGTKEDPFLDILTRLRQVRDASIKATGGLKELKKAIANLKSGGKNEGLFEGTENIMIKAGYSNDFISYLSGLDKKNAALNYTIKDGNIALTQRGKLMKAAMEMVTIGDFVKNKQNETKNLNDQTLAMKKLIAAGLSMEDALQIVQDQELANAVVHRATAKDLKEIKKAYEDAAAAAKLYAAQEAISNINKQTENTKKLLEMINQGKAAGWSDNIVNLFKNNTDLQNIALQFGVDSEQLRKAIEAALAGETFQIDIDLSTAEGMQASFDNAYGMVQDAFSAKETEIELAFKPKIAGQQKIIDAAQEQIDKINEKVDLYNRDLDKMSEQEDAINEKYDKRNEALDKIQKANDVIARQQKSQLTIADALSQGDIAAAAKAVQDERAQYAADSVQTQRDVYDAQRQSELDNVRNAQGLTRKEIEKAIKALNEEIYQIQKNTLEPAQKQLELLNKQKEEQLASVTVLGRTRDQWEAIKNQIDLARTNSQDYLDKIEKALNLVQQLIDKYKELNKTPPTPPPAPTDPGTAPNGQTPLPTDENGNVTVPPRGRPGELLLASKGGLIPQMFAAGGYARGTDTVPAMLTPGEFIMSKYAVGAYGTDTMKAINNGSFSGGSVYNSYEVNVNVRSDADPDTIARAVMTKINQLDSQRIRGNRV